MEIYATLIRKFLGKWKRNNTWLPSQIFWSVDNNRRITVAWFM